MSTLSNLSSGSSSLSSSTTSLNKKTTKNSETKPQIESSSKASVLPLWSRSVNKMQIGSIDQTGRYIPHLKHDPEDQEDDEIDLATSDDLNSAWNLNGDFSSVLDSNFDVNALSSSTKTRFRKKFNRLLNLLTINKGNRERSSSRSSNENGYFRVADMDEEDEKKLAEKIAAMIVNDVMKTNQLHS